MKLVIDARLYGLEHTGIGRYISHLLSELSVLDKKNHYTIVTTTNTQLGQLPTHSQVIRTDIKHYSFFEQTQLLTLLNNLDADLYHFPHFNVPLLFSKPFIVTIHDLLWHEKKGLGVTTLPSYQYLMKYLGYRMVVNHAVAKAKVILVPTRFVKHEIGKRYPQVIERVKVTYEAVDKSRFSANSKTKDSNYSLPSKFVVYTGNLYPHKNVITLVKALEYMPDIDLVICSARTAFTDEFTAQVSELGLKNRVHLLGFVPDADLSYIYQRAIALVQPSESEGFGLTGLEAMSLQLPVICSDHPVLHEVYGKAAIFTDTKDPQAIAKVISALASEPNKRAELIALGTTQVAKYSWTTMAQATLDAYNAAHDS